jgi:hypothetical protein
MSRNGTPGETPRAGRSTKSSSRGTRLVSRLPGGCRFAGHRRPTRIEILSGPVAARTLATALTRRGVAGSSVYRLAAG